MMQTVQTKANDSIIKRAFEILHSIECVKHDANSTDKSEDRCNQDEFEQVSFNETVKNTVLEDIKTLDLNTLTPIEALNILSNLKNSLVD